MAAVSGQQPRVVVFQYGEPRQKLMGWFLVDSGIAARVVHSQDDAVEMLARGIARVLIVNTLAPVADVAAVVKTLRIASPTARIIILHDGRHHEDDPEIPADACIHNVSDPDTLVDTVRAAIDDDLPDIEPHEAAEEAAGAGG